MWADTWRTLLARHCAPAVQAGLLRMLTCGVLRVPTLGCHRRQTLCLLLPSLLACVDETVRVRCATDTYT
jgi:hypothetical protein